jgi:hypothetical protein
MSLLPRREMCGSIILDLFSAPLIVMLVWFDVGVGQLRFASSASILRASFSSVAATAHFLAFFLQP